jgi:predicted membrane metal-binding protein
VTLARRHPTHVVAAAFCTGLALPNLVRFASSLVLVAALACALKRGAFLLLAVLLLAWWWGSVRLDAVDQSALAARIGTAGRARVVITSAPRRGRFEQRAQGVVLRFADLAPSESVLLRFPLQRAPPQGAVIDALGELAAPHPSSNGFDERAWLRRRGMHSVLRVDTWTLIGHRGGLGGIADRVRTWLRGSVARGLHGERAAVLEGVVLGDDGGLSDELRGRFRASGLYHLLRESQQAITA